MDPHPRPAPAPLLGPTLRVSEIDEGLPGEERATHERDGPLDARLVLRGTHPGRVDDEPAGLGVLDESLVEPRFERVGPLHNRLHVVGDHRREYTAIERPRRLEPGDHIVDPLAVGQPHEAVTRHHRREDQRVAVPLATRVRVRDPAHLPEINLQLVARLPVVHPHRDAPPAPAHITHLIGVTMQSPLRDDDPLTGQQLTHLHHRQPVGLEPRLDPVVTRHQQPPRLAVTVTAMRPHRLHHRTHELIAQLALAAVTTNTEPFRRGHITTDRLAVHPRQPLHRTQPLTTQPQTQNFSNLEHSNLPEHHRRPS